MKQISTHLQSAFIVMLCLFISPSSIKAELPAGSNVPDLTFLDLNNKYHRLYDALEEGKFIILDMFWTGCEPCWNYYQSGKLQQIETTLGPNGSNQVKVYSIETEFGSGLQCLYGPAGYYTDNNFTSYTYGNWVENANYTMANDSQFDNPFNLDAYPSYYILFPNKTLKPIPSPSVTSVQALIEQYENSQGLKGNNNAQIFDLKSNLNGNCMCDIDSIAPSVTIRNLGVKDLTSVDFQFYAFNTPMHTYTWTGNLASNEITEFTFPKFYFLKHNTLRIEATTVNNVTDEQASNNTVQVFIRKPTVVTGPGTFIKINLNSKANRFYWEFKDAEGAILQTGGNPLVGTNGGGAYDENNPVPDHPDAYVDSLFYHDTLRPLKPGCHEIKIVDGYANGLHRYIDGSAFALKNMPPGNTSMGSLEGLFEEMYWHFETKEGIIDTDEDGHPYETDCNDQNADIHPDATEICDGLDNNCNELLDDEDPLIEGLTVWYEDTDGDGVGNDFIFIQACNAPEGYVTIPGDCNDADSLMSTPTIWYADADGDGYSTDSVYVFACSQPDGYGTLTGDCDDTDSLINIPQIWFEDADDDGYGNENSTVSACLVPEGYGSAIGDCDDTNPEVYSTAIEIPNNGIDENCDGEDLITAIGENPAKKLTFYPNPGNGVLHVNTVSNEQLFFTVYDALGRVMIEQQSFTDRIHLISLPDGSYIVSGMNKDGHVVLREMYLLYR